MIISALLSVVELLVNVLFGWLYLPDLPDEFYSVLDKVLQYIQSARSILWLFFDFDFCVAMITIAIVASNFDYLYRLGRWILKKIPMLNID